MNTVQQEDNPLDLLTEDLIGLKEATQFVPTKPGLSTIWRWTTRGKKGIRLETIEIGDRRFTTKQAITRFIARTQSRLVPQSS